MQANTQPILVARHAGRTPVGHWDFGGKRQIGPTSKIIIEDNGIGMRRPRADVVGARRNESLPRAVLHGARVLDLCCGLGGLSLAASDLNMHIVAGVDLNSSALRTFARNFPQAEAIEGSIRSSTVLERCRSLLRPAFASPSVCLVLSGPPCQGFSAAGSRDPRDRRNKVLVAVARAIAQLQPDCALIENVSMLLADKHG
ncbi:MAG: DNA cytosine methyltransferase, partial [Dehalococcoidia bacterium]|nr:DNA cytosine methyltransferase [Dehalococcoidia bacterium]